MQPSTQSPISSRVGLQFVLAWLVLCVLAAVHGVELSTDSYEHFRASVSKMEALDWYLVVTDLWNKPLPMILYGIPGQWGLLPARGMSAGLTMISAACVLDVARRLWPATTPIRPAWAIVALVLQLSVLPESFVTMTELPAACALSLGLCLYVRGRVGAAIFVWGLLPLLRVEAVLMTATACAVVAYAAIKTTGWQIQTLRRVCGWAVLAVAPFVIWWTLGAVASENRHWFGEQSYASIRPWSLTGLLAVNAFSGLAAVLSAPMLFLSILGAWRWRSVVAPGRPDVTWLVAACVAVQFLFMTVAVVYPPATFNGLGVAAFNARNYNVIAPLLALLVLAGVERWVRWIERAADSARSWREYVVPAAITVGIGVGFYFMGITIGATAPPFRYKLAIGSLLLPAFLLGSAILRLRPIAAHAYVRPIVFSVLAMAALITMPTFWYPLASHDIRASSARAFCTWYGDTATVPPRIVQDYGALNTFCGIQNTNIDWIWPTKFLDEVRDKPGAWIMLTLYEPGTPSPYMYPRDLLDSLPTLRLLHTYPPPPVPRWQRVLNRFGLLNQTVGWQVYATR